MPSTTVDPLRSVAPLSFGMPRFSVIVPVLNGGRWLPDTLAAIESQTFPAEATEVLFVDNGSTDDSVEILNRHPRVRVLHEPHRDPYLARNRGIEAAIGEYLVFLDADCPPHADWLAEFDRSIHAAVADVLIGTLLHPATSPLMLKCYEAYYNTKIAWLIEHGRTSNFFGHAGNMVIRRDIFNAIGLFEAMPIVGDTEIIHRLLHSRADAVVRFVPRAQVVHAEVDTVGAMLTKLFAIGVYTQNLVPLGGYRPISLQDKVRITANSIRRLPHGLLGIPPLIAMLACGWAVYLSGRLVAALNDPAARRAPKRAA